MRSAGKEGGGPGTLPLVCCVTHTPAEGAVAFVASSSSHCSLIVGCIVTWCQCICKADAGVVLDGAGVWIHACEDFLEICVWCGGWEWSTCPGPVAVAATEYCGCLTALQHIDFVWFSSCQQNLQMQDSVKAVLFDTYLLIS